MFSDSLLIIIWFIIGSIIGSFMMCLTYEEQSLLRKSRCDACCQNLKWYDLIPVISFLQTRGYCRYCQQKISIKYLLCECLTGAALILISYNQVLDIALLCTIAIIIIPLAIYDTEHMLIPNLMLFILFTVLFINTLFLSFNQSQHINFTIIFYKVLIVLLLHLFFFLTHSIGYGDIKLFSILLIFLPIPFFISLFFVTYLIGGSACIVFLSYKTNIKRMPLVPFITAAFFVVLILYDAIKKLYFGGFF
ncbi:prepilin peptidase [Macrococcus equi]|uniref:prepilin peptidase n=1 Tax=Macrococcus equi TaxID=3395462 RepID=UPI0039BE2687